MKKKRTWAAALGLVFSGLIFVFLFYPQVFYREPPLQPLAEIDIGKITGGKNLSYDLVVVGTDPEGIAAAVSGARNGLSTLLVDHRPVPGGLITRGWLNTLDMNYGPDKEILNGGIFLEFFNQIGDVSFDVRKAQNVFAGMISREDNLDLLMSCRAITPITEKDEDMTTLKGVTISKDGLTVDINSPAVIDASQDADLAAAAGAAYTYGHEDFGRPDEAMAVTLVFRLGGINNLDWAKMYYHLKIDRNHHTGADYRTAWGFGAEAAKYEPLSDRIALRGLNIGRQDDYTVLVNALQIFDVNPLDNHSIDEAKKLAAEELPRLVDFLAQELPGFSHARLLDMAPELYVRESRHIQGECNLTIDDVLENRDFYDAVAFGSYPVDIQAASPGNKGYVLGRPLQYAVPFRSLIPLGIDNLLVVGRAAAFDSLAAGSARTIPVGMAAGQSAGVAAAVALKEGLTFRELGLPGLEEMKKRLNSQGLVLQPFNVQHSPEIDHWAYEGLKYMRRLGLAAGGYGNDYLLDEEMSEGKFINCLAWALKQVKGIEIDSACLINEGNELTVYDAAYMLACSLQAGVKTKKEAYDYLVSAGFWDEGLLSRVSKKEEAITNGMGYMLLKDFLERS